jgi:Ca2+-binding RTX toxin-like protein
MAWIVGTPFNDDGLFGTNFDDIIWGLEGNDSLYGGAGNDQLEGGLGADVMAGGTGNDTYYVDNAGDVVFEFGGQGTDTVRASISHTLAVAVENLILTGSAAINGTGNELNNQITGNGAANILSGGLGNDTLAGGAGNDSLKGGGGNDTLDGGIGADTMSGGAGGDIYYVDNTGDVIVETEPNPFASYDWVYSSISMTLGANVEAVILTGSAALNATGNSGSNRLTGNAASNVLTDGDGNDVLDGGFGADTMSAGAGSDVYIVDNIGDIVVENAGDGEDSIYSSITFTLGANFEHLFLTGRAAIDGTGNDLNNSLGGNDGDNVLRGLAGNDVLAGGAGFDTLIGGIGDDWYRYIDSIDVLVENAGEGIDKVSIDADYTLPDNFENLELFFYSLAVNATGNSADNEIVGSDYADNVLRGLAGNDTLSGRQGLDTLIGGTGDDIYVLDGDVDLVVENAGEGTDRVRTSFSYTLTDNVEALLLLDAFSGPISGSGNDLNNLIEGNSFANTLDGNAGADDMFGNGGNDTLFGKSGGDRLEGGAGADVLIGGEDADVLLGGADVDRFAFLTLGDSLAGGEDQVLDFAAGDRIDVSAIDADIAAGGDQAFVFIGNNNNFFAAGQLRFNGGFVEGDVDGDLAADFRIQVNVASMVDADFIL